MEYITAKPRTLTATEQHLLDCIKEAGWWSVKSRNMNYEQQEAIEFLWRTGYIERKAYGGWGAKVTAQPQPVTAADVLAILAAHGITPLGKVLACRDVRAWSPHCYAFEYRGLLPTAARAAFVRVGRFERVYIVELVDCPNGRGSE